MTSYLTYKQWLLPHNSLKFFHAPFSVFCSRLSIPSFIFWRKIRHIDYSLLNLWYAQIFSFLSSLVKPYFLDLSKKVSIYADELELKKENKDSGKAFFFLDLSKKFMIENLSQCCLIKEMAFPFISIARPLLIAINHPKYFMLTLTLKSYALPEQQKTLLIWQHVLSVIDNDEKAG